ncbi:hypothetical protein [Hymenobacter baengnokdamensis]|uniref:hypothetical protein n=1 Tax=Hymenobacter baengnokdamensis TaxID=2615203 RepID=UPI001246FC50|nr:hypothetical protein [Hymenobacter baengnokdamensis]
MARALDNPLLHGVSGKIGNLVVRQVAGQTIVSLAEAKGARAPRSPRQQAQLDRMYRAQQYAKAQLRDPAAKAHYATGIDRRRTSAYTVAIADYLNAPVIISLTSSKYFSQAGAWVQVVATDDFGVEAVLVRLRGVAGTLLEEGPASCQADGSWRYEVQATYPAGQIISFEAEAHDRPGNIAQATSLLP